MFARRSTISITTRTRCCGSPAPRETQQLPSETNTYFYEPRGLAAVIAPWNFPLAILTGMTAAALVTGNCVLMKPAEQSPIMGAQLLDILQSAGLPDGACQLLQGGGEIGAHLVRSPKIHLIAFTGSRQVGLEILREAYTHRPGQTHVKRVVCEMGGKNARHRRQRCRSRRSGGACHRFRLRLSRAEVLGGFAGDSAERSARSISAPAGRRRAAASRSARRKIRATPSAR